MTGSAKGRGFKAKAWIQRTPCADILPAVIVFIIVLCLAPSGAKDLTSFYAGLSALAGIIMSSITFTIMLAYGSSSSLMQSARKQYRDNFVHNWVGMISFSLLAALLPLISILVEWFMKLGPALSAASIVLIVEEGARCIFWVRFTLIMDARSPEQDDDGFNQESAVEAVKKYGQSK